MNGSPRSLATVDGTRRTAPPQRGERIGAHAQDRPLRGGGQPPPPTVARPRRSRRGRAAQWLLLIPVTMPLLVPLYNRIDPQLWGIPFFYWYQFACVLVAISVTTVVYLLSKERR